MSDIAAVGLDEDLCRRLDGATPLHVHPVAVDRLGRWLGGAHQGPVLVGPDADPAAVATVVSGRVPMLVLVEGIARGVVAALEITPGAGTDVVYVDTDEELGRIVGTIEDAHARHERRRHHAAVLAAARAQVEAVEEWGLRALRPPGERLRTSIEAVEHRLERAESDAGGAVDTFAATLLRAVAHDLRSPLASVGGLAEVLATRAPELARDELAEIGARIGRTAAQVTALLESMLDLDRLTTRGLRPAPRRVDAAAVCRICVTGLALERDVVVRPDGRVDAVVDPMILERIVENLVRNADRYHDGPESVEVSVEVAPDGLHLEVADRGPGVPDADKERIFEPHRSAGNLGARGVGLAVVAGFAAAHGGRAWVTDRAGGGSSFRVVLGPAPAA